MLTCFCFILEMANSSQTEMDETNITESEVNTEIGLIQITEIELFQLFIQEVNTSEAKY